jgi:hypothetical protein
MQQSKVKRTATLSFVQKFFVAYCMTAIAPRASTDMPGPVPDRMILSRAGIRLPIS